ncbi:hypothetical protein PRZ48_008651 [Zasmidium cellare]|uniref:Uncharacterized protein n=1 Tax=Zasmidium cellare TaxID=395010 RepID=A0ABR0EG21_ZASCE|nr:hypothetical protein PRZ48_008651 [Zasmidium cellare]
MGRPPKVGEVGMADFKKFVKRGPPAGPRYWKPSAFYDIERTNVEYLRSLNPFAAPDPQPAPATTKKVTKKVVSKTTTARADKNKTTGASKGTKSLEVRQSTKPAERASGAEEAKGRKASSARGKRTDSMLSLTGLQGLEKAESDIAKMNMGDDMEEDTDEDNAPAHRRDTRGKTAAEEAEMDKAMAKSLLEMFGEKEVVETIVETNVVDANLIKANNDKVNIDEVNNFEASNVESNIIETNDIGGTTSFDTFWPPYGTDTIPPPEPTCFLGLARVPADIAYAFKTELGQHLQVFYQNTQFSSEPAPNTNEDLEDVGVEFISKDVDVAKRIKDAIDGMEVQGKKLQVVFAHEW